MNQRSNRSQNKRDSQGQTKQSKNTYHKRPPSKELRAHSTLSHGENKTNHHHSLSYSHSEK